LREALKIKKVFFVEIRKQQKMALEISMASYTKKRKLI